MQVDVQSFDSPTNKAVIYARYSTDNQSPDTIEVQVQKCAEYAQERGITITDIFADEAVSGMKRSRPELERFFMEASAGKIKCVLIYDQSRFSRDIVDWFTFRRALQNNSIQLISVTQSFVGGDLNDPAVFASEGINALVNQLHVLQTRQKVKEKMTFIARQGLHTGGRPLLGYNVVDKHYVINEYEADIVRRIFLMYAEGSSYREIIAALNKKGYKTKAGKTFGSNSLHSILRNERYIGTYTYNKIPPAKNGKRNSHAISQDMIRIEGALPELITREVWDKVQKRLSNNKQNGRNTAKIDYLLSGKIFCGKCGMAMTGISGKGGQYHYYSCSGKKRLHNCDKKVIAKERIEDAVVQLILDKVLAPDIIEATARQVYDSQSQIRNELNPLMQGIQKRLREVDAKINNLNNAIADGIYSTSTVTMLKELENEQLKLYDQLGSVEKNKVATHMSYASILKTLKQVATDYYDDLNRKTIIYFVERVIVYDDDTIKIYFNPLELQEVTIPVVTSDTTASGAVCGESKKVLTANGVALPALLQNRLNHWVQADFCYPAAEAFIPQNLRYPTNTPILLHSYSRACI